MLDADVTIIEPNEKSCKIAGELFKRNNYSVDIINKSLFDIDIKFLQEFDVVIAEGVLHHTFDAISALKIILENIHKHAMVMIAIPEYHGWYKRFLQRLLILEMSDSEEDIIHNAKKYIPFYLIIHSLIYTVIFYKLLCLRINKLNV